MEKKPLLKPRITEALDKLSSKKPIRYGMYSTAVITFFALILVPPILGIIIKWSALQHILTQPEYTSRALNAITNSFVIALLVSTVDIVAGIPMAWLITRGKSKWLNVLDTLSDIPFIVPTAALGYSLLLFWNDPEGISYLFGSSLISLGWFLVALLHFTFSYPVVVRVVVGALLDYKMEYEQASRTLGAPPLMATRTVTFPILKPSLIAAFILAFSRSISETGATMIVAGATFENGPAFIQKIANDFRAVPPKVDQLTYDGSIAFASFVLIAIAFAIFAVIQFLGPKLKLPLRRTWPTFERKLSYSKAASARNSLTLLIFFAIILIPSLFVALPAFEAIFTPILPDTISRVGIWNEYWQSLILSYSLASIATLLNVIIGLPMAILVARRKAGRLVSAVLDLFVNIPLIVPSIALGVSLNFFWRQTFASVPELLLLIFAHLAITYPYFVRSMSAAVERIGLDTEEAAKTLGAKPLAVFRTMILPLTKYSILSGAIMVFTRSVSETGATLAVVTTLRTAPVVIVDWVRLRLAANPSAPSSLEIGLGCGFLILFSFIILFALRLIVRGKGRY